MEKNDAIDMRDAPSITLGKGANARTFKIPELAAKQAGKVSEIVYDMMTVFAHMAAALKSGETPQVKITEDHFNRMVEVVWLGIVRNYPEVTREAMDDWPFGLLQLIPACMTVAKQAGMFPEEGKSVPGPLEVAEALASGPIGAAPSPPSAQEQAGPGTT